MDDNIINKANKLSDALKSDPSIAKLNELEELLNNNDEAKILSYKMDVASMNYSDALKIYDRHDERMKPYILALAKAKENLNNLDIVKQYNQAYKEVKDIYSKINEIVFDDLRVPLAFKK